MKWNQIAVAFFIGLIIGTFATVTLRRTMRRNWNRDAMHARLIKKFERRLELSADQKAQVEKIFDANRVKMDSLFSEIRPKLELLRKDTGVEVKKILNEKQQKEYDKLDAEMSARMGRHFPPPPPEPEK